MRRFDLFKFQVERLDSPGFDQNNALGTASNSISHNHIHQGRNFPTDLHNHIHQGLVPSLVTFGLSILLPFASLSFPSSMAISDHKKGSLREGKHCEGTMRMMREQVILSDFNKERPGREYLVRIIVVIFNDMCSVYSRCFAIRP